MWSHIEIVQCTLLAMTSITILIECYIALQQNRMQPHLITLITSKGRITIPLNIFLSFRDITDVTLLLEYERLLKSKNNFAFTSLISLTWEKTPRGVKLKWNFDLDVSEIRLRQLLDYLETPAPQILDEADDGINDEAPASEVLDEADDGINDEAPASEVLDEADDGINDEPPVGEVLDEADEGIDDEAPVGEVVDEVHDGIDDQPPVAEGKKPR